jgi:hypothetical protein
MEKISKDIVNITGCHSPMPFKSEWISDSMKVEVGLRSLEGRVEARSTNSL